MTPTARCFASRTHAARSLTLPTCRNPGGEGLLPPGGALRRQSEGWQRALGPGGFPGPLFCPRCVAPTCLPTPSGADSRPRPVSRRHPGPLPPRPSPQPNWIRRCCLLRGSARCSKSGSQTSSQGGRDGQDAPVCPPARSGRSSVSLGDRQRGHRSWRWRLRVGLRLRCLGLESPLSFPHSACSAIELEKPCRGAVEWGP